jgi:BirA family biotin operon repressor/biotin-[acetyl-CoA-carboxylase] ligase
MFLKILMSEFQLLKILSDGQYHSGEELGSQLGISRTAVWKQLKKIDSLGVSLDSTKGKGYCLPGGISLLDKDDIVAAMSTASQEVLTCIDVEAVIDSTNIKAMGYAQKGLAYPYVCTAEKQTGGRGRRGREWFSPYARNLYFSFTWGFSGGAASLEGLSLAVGVVVAEVLYECGVEDIQLKWPNDILCAEKKLSGILLEMTGDPAGLCQVVIGIGMNVSMQNVDAEKIDQPWTDLESILHRQINRSELQAKLLDALFGLLMGYEQAGFSTYQKRFSDRDIHAGKSVVVKLGDRVVIGRSAGVNKTGALLVETELGIEVFNGGEVSLRRSNAS